MFDGGVAAFSGCELGLLQVDVRGHPIACVTIGKIEHRQVECVKARKRNELECVTHLG